MNSKTKTILVTAALVAVIAGLLLRQQFQANARLQTELDAAQKQATTLKAQQQKLKSQLSDQAVDLQIQQAGAQPHSPTHSKINPRAPMPGAYPAANLAAYKQEVAEANAKNMPLMRDAVGDAAKMAELERPALEASLRYKYGDFFQKMQFTSDQIGAFIKIQTNKQAANQVSWQQYQADNPLYPNNTPPDNVPLKQIVQDNLSMAQNHDTVTQPMADAANAQLQQMLGDDNYAYYQDYTASSQVRSAILSNVAPALDAAGLPSLTLDQVEQLTSLAYQNTVNANGDPATAAQSFPQVLQQASAFLTPEQIQVLQQPQLIKSLTPQYWPADKASANIPAQTILSVGLTPQKFIPPPIHPLVSQ